MNKGTATKIVFSVAFWIVLLYLATKLNFGILIDAFDRINWDIFIFSTIVFILAIYFDGYAWKYMLNHIWHEKLPISTTTNIHYTAVGMGQMFPSGGASELATRVWLMKRQLGVPDEEVLGSMLLFRLFFYCTTFISTFLFIWSLFVLGVIDFQLSVLLLIVFYIIEFIGLVFLALIFYRLDLVNKIFALIERLIPLDFVKRFNQFLMAKITGISEKFVDVKNEFSNRRQIAIFLAFVVIQYTIRQIAIWSMYYILIPNITLPPIIVATTITTFLTSLPLIIPGNQGVRELGNFLFLKPFLPATTDVTEVVVLIGTMAGVQIWIVGFLSVLVILYYYLFKHPKKATSENKSNVSVANESVESSSLKNQTEVNN